MSPFFTKIINFQVEHHFYKNLEFISNYLKQIGNGRHVNLCIKMFWLTNKAIEISPKTDKYEFNLIDRFGDFPDERSERSTRYITEHFLNCPYKKK